MLPDEWKPSGSTLAPIDARKGKDKLCFYFHPNGTKLTEGETKKLQDGGMKRPQVKSPSTGKRQQNNHGEKTNYEPFQILASYTTVVAYPGAPRLFVVNLL